MRARSIRSIEGLPAILRMDRSMWFRSHHYFLRPYDIPAWLVVHYRPITYYLMVFIDPVLYVGWKLIKRTKVVKPSEADLHWDKAAIDAYQDSFNEEPVGFWA